MSEVWLVRAKCTTYECCGHTLAVASSAEKAEELKIQASTMSYELYLGRLVGIAVHGPFIEDGMLPFTVI